jgi:hypothetical protein
VALGPSTGLLGRAENHLTSVRFTFGQGRHEWLRYRPHGSALLLRIRFIADGGDTTEQWLMLISSSGGSSLESSASEETPGRKGGIGTEAVCTPRGNTTLKSVAIRPDDQRVRLSLRRTWP